MQRRERLKPFWHDNSLPIWLESPWNGLIVYVYDDNKNDDGDDNVDEDDDGDNMNEDDDREKLVSNIL